MYKVEFTQRALKDLKKLDKQTAALILGWVRKNLEGCENPRQHGKAAYVERNQEMINQSNFCVIYYDENYTPPRRRKSKRDLVDYQPKSGTRIAYNYAVKKNAK